MSAKLPCQLYMFKNVLYKIIEKNILFFTADASMVTMPQS